MSFQTRSELLLSFCLPNTVARYALTKQKSDPPAKPVVLHMRL